jgi:hypothetical protein
MYPITVGADPELCLSKNGKFIAAVGIFPGTKEQPYAVSNSKIGLTIQEDGVMLELGWLPTPPEDFRNTVKQSWKEVGAVVATYGGPEAAYHAYSTASYTADQLKSKQAMTCGCDPDLVAYPRESKRRAPIISPGQTARFCGGHLHFGYDKDNTPVPEWAIVQFADFGYLWAIYNGYDHQGERRSKYGLPGLYRKKPYGLEYRTPSNFWYTDPSKAMPIINAVQWVLSKPEFARSLRAEIPWDLVQESIRRETLLVPSGQFETLWDRLETARDEYPQMKKQKAA